MFYLLSVVFYRTQLRVSSTYTFLLYLITYSFIIVTVIYNRFVSYYNTVIFYRT
jgi:hypothetical protein